MIGASGEPAFTVYPAIDVRAGAVVRLAQGDYADETRYGNDPLALAVAYARAGAKWLHLVDLDAARNGGYTLLPLLDAIRRRTTLQVQTGGGVRGEDDVQRLLDAGADRVVIGSLAVAEPARVCGWLRRFSIDRLTIALDVRLGGGGWVPASHGWTVAGTSTLKQLLSLYVEAGLRHLLCTDITRDGMLVGPNLELYAAILRQAPRLQLQASGGARDLPDLRAARAAGCAGIVLGKALLEGRLDLAQALAEQAAC